MLQQNRTENRKRTNVIAVCQVTTVGQTETHETVLGLQKRRQSGEATKPLR